MPTQHTWYEEEMKDFDNTFSPMIGLTHTGDFNLKKIILYGNKLPGDWIKEHNRRLIERIEKRIIEQAEPYDDAKWHNNLSFETINKVLATLKDELK